MTFVVEDGTGLPNSTSYVSVAYADAYFADRGNTVWPTLTQPLKEAALINGTDYIDLRWGPFLAGMKFKDDQALQFPRKMCCDSDVAMFPAALLKACCEYAVRASQEPLFQDPEYDSTNRLATKVKEKVGPIEEERGWGATGATSAPVPFRSYPGADMYMAGLLRPGLGGGRVMR